MTREEFDEQVTDFRELMNFMYEHDLEFDECIYDRYDASERIDEDLYDLSRNESWQDVRDILNNAYDVLEWGDWFVYEGNASLRDITDDFDRWKADAREMAEDDGVFEEDEENVEPEPEADLEPAEPVFTGDTSESVIARINAKNSPAPACEFDFSELIMSCGEEISGIMPPLEIPERPEPVNTDYRFDPFYDDDDDLVF